MEVFEFLYNVFFLLIGSRENNSCNTIVLIQQSQQIIKKTGVDIAEIG